MPNLTKIERRLQLAHFHLVDALTRWRNLLSSRTFNSLEARLINRVGSLITSLKRTSPQSFLTLKENLKELKNLIKEYRNKRKELSPYEKELIKQVEIWTQTLERRIGQRFAQRQIDENSLPALTSHFLPPEQENFIKGQLKLKPTEINLSARLEEFISLEPLTKNNELQFLPKVKLTPEETKLERDHVLSEIFIRALNAFLVEKLTRGLNDAKEKVVELTAKEIERVLKEINAEINRINLEKRLKTKPEIVAVNREKIEALREERRGETQEIAEEKQSSSGDGKVIYRIVYDQKRNIVRVEIITRASKPEIDKTMSDFICKNPKETIPKLVEEAAKILVNEPNARAEILNLVTQSTAILFANKQDVLSKVKESIVKELLDNNFIHELKNETNSSLQGAKREIVKTFFSQAPEVTLPALIQEASYLSSSGGKEVSLQIIESLACEIAQSEKGQKYVLHEVASEENTKLKNSELGQKIIIEVAKNILSQATINQNPLGFALPTTSRQPENLLKNFDSNLTISTSKTEKEIMVNNLLNQAVANQDKRTFFSQVKALNAKGLNAQILYLAEKVAAANLSQFTKEKNDFKTAFTFLSFVAQIQQCLNALNNQKIQRTAKAPNKNIQQVLVKHIAQKALKEGKVRERAQALRKLLNLARDHNLVIPKEVLQHLYAGLAGIPITPGKIEVPQNFSLPKESAAASSLRRIAQILEAQISRAVSRNHPVSWTKVYTLSAQAFLYGTIMRLVKGHLEKVDEVIKRLKDKGKLTSIVKKIKVAEIESALEEIAEEVLILELFELTQVPSAA